MNAFPIRVKIQINILNLNKEYLLSRIPKEELAKAEKMAKKQNTTTIEDIKKEIC